ncbi:MAG: twin-arginine translocase subunit TatC [Infirmifilum sp.]
MSELPEKPLLEHVYELLETMRKILIVWVGIIASLLVLPAPHLLPSYTPLAFYFMNLTKRVMLSHDEHPITRQLSLTLGLNDSKVILISHGWFDSLMAAVIMSGLIAVTVSTPITLYYIYRFLEPGLYSHEKKIIKKYLFAVNFLFIMGVAYGFFIVTPLTFLVALWIAKLGGASPYFAIHDFYQNVFLGSVAIGIFFTFPLVILALNKVGLVNRETLEKNWRYVILLTLSILVVITPDPTPTSALAIGLPFIVLYLLSIRLIKKISQKLV